MDAPKNSEMESFFQDYDGGKSFGRLAAGYLIVASLACFSTAILVPTAAATAITFMKAFLVAAGSFFGSNKGTEIAASFSSMLGKRRSDSDSASAPVADAPSTPGAA